MWPGKQCFPKLGLDAGGFVLLNHARQGPWNADLRTPPGPEGSNGSLLYICRGVPDTSSHLCFKHLLF